MSRTKHAKRTRPAQALYTDVARYAKEHGNDQGAEYEVGDYQQAFEAALRYLSTAQVDDLRETLIILGFRIETDDVN